MICYIRNMFTLQPLPYGYNALEPFIDEETMHLHHGKHHQAYVDNLNKALETYPEFQNSPLEKILAGLDKIPEDIRQKVKNQAGGVWNHTFFWNIMAPGKNEVPAEFKEFIEPFSASALSLFGSGWTWLIKDQGQIKIVNTSNQDSPISAGQVPILALDLWEHAYYLKYQNRRKEYIEAWWNVVNWEKVTSLSQ